MASRGWDSYEVALLAMLEECQGQRHPNRREAPAEAEGQAGNSRDQPLSYAKLSENAEAMTYFTGLRRGALDWLFPRLVAKVICWCERLFVFVRFVWAVRTRHGVALDTSRANALCRWKRHTKPTAEHRLATGRLMLAT